MKIEPNTLNPAQTIPGSEKGSFGTVVTRVMLDQTVTQGETVATQPLVGSSGVPEIPDPDETASVDLAGFEGGQSVNIQQLLMWIANMAAEYIKQQNELLKTRQKAVEGGYQASMEAAQNNFDKNLTQAIVGIVGASVSLIGAGIAGFKLGSAGKEIMGLKGLEGDDLKIKTATIDQITATGQTWNAAAGSLSQGAQNIGGIASAHQELDAKKQEALSQLIAKTAESISSNEGSARQIIDKFANDLMAMLKNFYASTTR